jgi:ketosteroid isomerase-like protein
VGSENAAALKSAIEMYNRGEIDELFARYAAPDVEFDYTRSNAPDQTGVFRGTEEAKRPVKALREPWVELELVADEYIEVADDVVVVRSHTRHVGRDGIEVIAHGAMVFEFRDDGKVTAWRLFQNREEALEAARAID